MKIKTWLLGIAAIVALTPAAVRSQEFDVGFLDRTVAWFTGDSSILSGGSAGPSNYAEDTSCSTGTCGCCNQCCRCLDVWGSAEFLLWWAKGTNAGPLVTTSVPSTTPIAQAGVLNQPNTQILFGNQLGGNGMQAGGRITAGMWLDSDHNVAAGGRFFGLGGDRTTFSRTSAGDPILAIPFIDSTLNPPNEAALLIAYPNLSAGSITARLRTSNIIGAEAFGELMMLRDGDRRLDLVGGYQFFRLDDSLTINNTTTITDIGNPAVGTQFVGLDQFLSRNTFNGGMLGVRGRMARGNWALDALGKIGLGNMHEQIVIAGSTVTTSPGNPPTTAPGNLLTQPSNIGSFSRDRFAAIPEVTLNLKYYVGPNVNFHIGYNIIWITQVALAADQVDRTVNLSQPAGPARPAFAFRGESDYWVQGINFGANWDF